MHLFVSAAERQEEVRIRRTCITMDAVRPPANVKATRMVQSLSVPLGHETEIPAVSVAYSSVALFEIHRREYIRKTTTRMAMPISTLTDISTVVPDARFPISVGVPGLPLSMDIRSSMSPIHDILCSLAMLRESSHVNRSSPHLDAMTSLAGGDQAHLVPRNRQGRSER